MATKIRIDDVFDKLYAKLHLHASTSWLEYLNSTKGTCRDILVYMGLRIPRQCWFKKTFNLSWTPCKLNPFFEHLIELSCWAHEKHSENFLADLYEELGVNPYVSEED